MKKIFLLNLAFLLICGNAFGATTYTTNYNLSKPGVGDTGWGAAVNTNFDTIDTQMKTNADAISTHTSDNTQAHSDYLINNGDDTTSGTITASGFIGNVTGNVSGTSGSTTGNAGTATALAANGANCNAGNFPLGVDASGAVESCTDVWTEAENTSAGYAPLVSPSFTTPTLGVATATSVNKVTITAPATGSTLTIADGKTLTATNTVNLNTMTDGKWCKYTAAGTVLNCDQDAPAGTGDVSDVGDCTGGACLDGTSDGGTYIRLHETASGFYGSITPSGLSGNTSYTLPNQAGILLSSGYLANSAALRGLLSDESGTGAAIFAGGDIGAATATTPAENDNDTSVATTAYVQTEISGIVAGDVNWAEMPLIMSAGVNWTDLEALAPINSSAVNWADIEVLQPMSALAIELGSVEVGGTSLVQVGAVNWNSGDYIDPTAVNWLMADQLIQSANVNWANIETLAPINNAAVNWADMTDLGEAGTVVWTNLAEGELPDSSIVSADINWTNIENITDANINWLAFPTFTDDYYLRANGTGVAFEAVAGGTENHQVCIIVDGGGSAVTTGAKGFVRIPNSFTIGGAEITADQSGSCVVDLWVDSYANFPPDNSDSICDSGTCPTLSTAQKAQDTTLTSWTTSITAGSYLKANVDSCSTVKRVEVCIYE